MSALGFGCVAAGDGVCRKVGAEAGGEMSGNRGTRFGRWGMFVFFVGRSVGQLPKYWAFRDRGMLMCFEVADSFLVVEAVGCFSLEKDPPHCRMQQDEHISMVRFLAAGEH